MRIMKLYRARADKWHAVGLARHETLARTDKAFSIALSALARELAEAINASLCEISGNVAAEWLWFNAAAAAAAYLAITSTLWARD